MNDPKTEWIKLVNKHKKRQKGLPISKLNTDAGDVETNIKIFNAAQPVSDAPAQGNIGACESLQRSSNKCDNQLDDKFDMSLRTLL